jgi:hypothetical protein
VNQSFTRFRTQSRFQQQRFSLKARFKSQGHGRSFATRTKVRVVLKR